MKAGVWKAVHSAPSRTWFGDGVLVRPPRLLALLQIPLLFHQFAAVIGVTRSALCKTIDGQKPFESGSYFFQISIVNSPWPRRAERWKQYKTHANICLPSENSNLVQKASWRIAPGALGPRRPTTCFSNVIYGRHAFRMLWRHHACAGWNAVRPVYRILLLVLKELQADWKWGLLGPEVAEGKGLTERKSYFAAPSHSLSVRGLRTDCFRQLGGNYTPTSHQRSLLEQVEELYSAGCPLTPCITTPSRVRSFWTVLGELSLFCVKPHHVELFVSAPESLPLTMGKQYICDRIKQIWHCKG